MDSVSVAYLPYHVALALAERPLLPGFAEQVEAITLFADVSGFTPLTEALGQSGQRGAEELTDILNSYFAPMIRLVHQYGGIVAKFGGDALTVMFPTTDAERAATARRALQCALEMQQRMPAYAQIPTSAGSFGLTMKAGLASGRLLCGIAGDAGRLEYIIAGRALDACADAEHHARSGDVVAESALLPLFGPVELEEQRGAFSCIRRLIHPAEPHPLPPPPAVEASRLRPYLHPTIADRLATGQSRFVNEHRRVSVLFVRFQGFDYDHDPEVMARLQHYLATVVATIRHYDGYLARVDMGDKGSKLIILFGAPVAHEDDPARAARCALDLLAIPEVVSQIGMTTGRVFTGEVGSDERKEYTVMGDTVNLAARLMQAAQPGQVLADRVTRQAAHVVAWLDLPALRVKGKQHPVEVAQIQAMSRPAATTAHQVPLIGREAELAQLVQLCQRASHGHGQLIRVYGEAGVGKSRLVAELCQQIQRQGFWVLRGVFPGYGAISAYQGWHAIWQAFFAVEAEPSAEVIAQQLEHQLAALDRRYVTRAPLLGPLLGINLPENDLTRNLDPELRDQLRHTLAVSTIRQRSRQDVPFVLVLEDAHWIDPQSLELLQALAQAIADCPVVIVVSYRPPTAEPDRLAALGAPHYNTPLLVAELTNASAQQLLQQWLQDHHHPPLEPALRERLITQAQGNPLFLEELLNLVQQQPAIFNQPDQLNLPDSLHALLLSRIDQLDQRLQTVLKSASVFGQQFQLSWINGAYPQLGGYQHLHAQLHSLAQLDLTPLEQEGADPKYRFRHGLLQTAAYESLTFAHRASLHEQVGGFLEQAPHHDLDQLAYHYGRSDNRGKQRIYFHAAGDAARASYSNRKALDYYQRLLPLVEPAQQATILASQAEIWRLIGAWPDAEAACRQGLVLAEAAEDTATAAECQVVLGAILARTESYAAALELLEPARARFQQLGASLGLSRALEQLSFAYYQLGQLDQSLEAAEAQLAITQAIDDQRGESDALAQLGHIWMQRGDVPQALACYQQAALRATAVGYRRREVLLHGDLAALHYETGDYAAALSEVQRGIEAAREIDYTWFEGLLLGNAGLIYADYGSAHVARRAYLQALQIAVAINNLPECLVQIGRLAALEASQGHYAEAERLCAWGIPAARMLDLPYDLCEQLVLVAEARAAVAASPAEWQQVAAYAQEAVAIATRVEAADVVISAQIVGLQAAVASGQISVAEALDQLGNLVPQARPMAQAMIHQAIWNLDHQRSDAYQAALQGYQGSQHATARRRYAQLTGQTPPEPPALPLLPMLHHDIDTNLDTLLAQIPLQPEREGST